MHKKILILFFIFCSSASAFAEDMIFWYPGEAGSSEQAQPLLDEFTRYINSKDAEIKITASYFNTIEDGERFINDKKPLLGILSNFIWEREREKDKFSDALFWLATNPLPVGKKAEQYALVGKTDNLPAEIYSSEPLDIDYVRNHLKLLKKDDNSSLKDTPQLLLKLKSISEGTTSGAISALAILTPVEYSTLIRLSAPWTKNIKIIALSVPIPTPGVVLFREPPQNIIPLRDILLKMKDDPLAKGLLEEMRLMGFSEP